jgi:CheY-like chemotaxis protein
MLDGLMGMGEKDRFGACNKCRSHDRLSFVKDMDTNEYRWLCLKCRPRVSGAWTAAELMEIDRQQARLFRSEREHRVSSGKIRVAAPPPGGPILVVEDDPAIRESVCTILEDEGYRVVSAGNGKEAIDMLRALTPAPRLILLDLMMPVMNGWEFYARTRTDDVVAAIPVVVMSAYEGDARTGSLTLLRKPLRLDELLAAVTEGTPP